MEDQDALKPKDTKLTGSNSVHIPKATEDIPAAERPRKRKHDVQETAGLGADPKLQEFLEVMQPPSKSKTWANEDTIKENGGGVSLLPTVIPSGAEGQSDHEYEPVPKKRKKSVESIQAEAAPAPIKPNVAARQEALEPSTAIEEQSLPTQQAETAASDADWLRSRTSRLLGLVDDEDIGVLAPLSSEVNREKTMPLQKEQSPTSDVSVQTDEEPTKEAPATANVSTLERPEDNSITGRLFVRNLPYSIAEDELRAHFASYGELEEVSVLFSMNRHQQSLCYDLVMNILIGTAYAMHVMLPGRVF